MSCSVYHYNPQNTGCLLISSAHPIGAPHVIGLLFRITWGAPIGYGTSLRTPRLSAGSHICVWNIIDISSRAYWRGIFGFWVWNRKILTRSNSSGDLLSLSQLCCLNVALCSLILVVCTKSFTCYFLSVDRTSTSNWKIHLTTTQMLSPLIGLSHA